MGSFQHLALADRSAHRSAGFRYQEACANIGEDSVAPSGLQGRHEVGRQKRR